MHWIFFFDETVTSATKNLFLSSVHLILLTRRQKKRGFPLFAFKSENWHWGVSDHPLHTCISTHGITPSTFLPTCCFLLVSFSRAFSTLWGFSFHVPAYLHRHFAVILPGLLFLAILIFALDFFFLKPTILFMKPQLSNFIAPISPSSGLHFLLKTYSLCFHRYLGTHFHLKSMGA